MMVCAVGDVPVGLRGRFSVWRLVVRWDVSGLVGGDFLVVQLMTDYRLTLLLQEWLQLTIHLVVEFLHRWDQLQLNLQMFYLLSLFHLMRM